jgi:hypothetical protein
VARSGPRARTSRRQELLNAKEAALECFASQQQLDMDVFRKLAEVAYRQHVHHRVVGRFPPGSDCAELFRTAREIELANGVTGTSIELPGIKIEER